MIFVPCKDGISHNEIEDAEPRDLAAGAPFCCRQSSSGRTRLKSARSRRSETRRVRVDDIVRDAGTARVRSADFEAHLPRTGRFLQSQVAVRQRHDHVVMACTWCPVSAPGAKRHSVTITRSLLTCAIDVACIMLRLRSVLLCQNQPRAKGRSCGWVWLIETAVQSVQSGQQCAEPSIMPVSRTRAFMPVPHQIVAPCESIVAGKGDTNCPLARAPAHVVSSPNIIPCPAMAAV